MTIKTKIYVVLLTVFLIACTSSKNKISPKILNYSTENEIKSIPKEQIKGIIKDGLYTNEFIGFEYTIPVNSNWLSKYDFDIDSSSLFDGYHKISTLFWKVDQNNPLREIIAYAYFSKDRFKDPTRYTTWAKEVEKSNIEKLETVIIDDVLFETFTFTDKIPKTKASLEDDMLCKTAILDEQGKNIMKEAVITKFFGEHNNVMYLFEITSSKEQYLKDIELFKNSIKFQKSDYVKTSNAEKTKDIKNTINEVETNKYTKGRAKVLKFSTEEEVRNQPDEDFKGLIKDGLYVNEFIGLEYIIPTNGNWNVQTDTSVPYNAIPKVTIAPFSCVDIDNSIRTLGASVYYGREGFNDSHAHLAWDLSKQEAKASNVTTVKKTKIDDVDFDFITYNIEQTKTTIKKEANQLNYYSDLEAPKEKVIKTVFYGELNKIVYYFELTSSTKQYEDDLNQFKDSIRIWK